MRLMGLSFFLAKVQHQQGTCSNVTGSHADPLPPFGNGGQFDASAPAAAGQVSMHQGSGPVCLDVHGLLLEPHLGIW